MKQIALILLIGIGQIMACSSDNKEADLSAEQAALQDSLDRVAIDEDLIRTASARLISEFSGELKSRLVASIQSGGPTRAIEVCGLEASSIADSMSRGGFTIRRVTDKNRSPDNRATLAEKDIMAVFVDSTQPRRQFFGDWKTEDSLTSYTYYKPIFVKRFCLQCHGDMQTLAPGVYQAVKRHYPMDKATGYRKGDLRGMFVVKAMWPDGKDFAIALLAGHAFDSDTIETKTDTTVVDSLSGEDTVE